MRLAIGRVYAVINRNALVGAPHCRRTLGKDLQALSLVQMLVGEGFPSAQNFDPDELSFRIEVEDDLARRSSASTRRSILGVDR